MTAEQMIMVTRLIGEYNVLDIEENWSWYISLILDKNREVRIHKQGQETWIQDTLMHREDGPASVGDSQGREHGKEWWWHGKLVTEEEHAAATKER
jgi:hypothetical protein